MHWNAKHMEIKKAGIRTIYASYKYYLLFYFLSAVESNVTVILQSSMLDACDAGTYL